MKGLFKFFPVSSEVMLL